MATLPQGHDVPWQRVINSQGKISPRSTGDGCLVQKMLLEAEDVSFDDRRVVDLARFGWNF